MIIDIQFKKISYLCAAVPLLQRTLILCMVLLVFAAPANAAMIYGTSAAGELTGSRTVTDPGLTTTDPTDWGDAVVSWVITDNGNGTLHYEYTFTGFNKPDISHVDIDISDDAISGNALADPNAVTGATLNGNLIPTNLVEFGDFDGLTGSVKFDINDETSTILVYAFDSNRSPVYGHLVVKGGQELLTNTGLTDPSSMDILDFIARPNGAVIPEPSGMVLLAWAFVASAIGLRRKPLRSAIA